jgi:hypothetical protein
MSPASEFDIGSEVACSDGVCGVLSRVVVDPVAQAVTQLVIEPRHGRAEGHLVPIRYVNSGGKLIELSCTRAQFGEFDCAEETDYLPAPAGAIGYGSEDVLTLPFWRLRLTEGRPRCRHRPCSRLRGPQSCPGLEPIGPAQRPGRHVR